MVDWIAEFEHLNPVHFVPVLVEGDLVVSDSFAILLVSNHYECEHFSFLGAHGF